MSRQTQSHDTDDRDTKEARLQHPSGFLYLTQHESVPILIDALLDLPPGREFNKTELADHAGVTRQTVGAYIDVLIETGVLEEVPKTSPQRYRLAESEVVEELFALNSALNAIRE
ncbi:helix-turn-helix domain-containing protein [Halapricum salinum]|uniref:MarR family transcriptional regulator n=1 Tax=Halapricum salinum TaxID=1457250 RepID=A0A4D6HB96_9EURY|nr:hypothetical protein [Halapricum salinum]QCC51209.1 hypothetical protein DV733_08115 [Halapricum salinum]